MSLYVGLMVSECSAVSGGIMLKVAWLGGCLPKPSPVLTVSNTGNLHLSHQQEHRNTQHYIMPAKDQGFSEDQIEDFKEVFQLFDTKGDGLIQVRSS